MAKRKVKGVNEDNSFRVMRKRGEADMEQLQSLMDAFESTLTAFEPYMKQALLAEDTRWCQWANQSDDGRKWPVEGSDAQVFPFPGASDSRVRLTERFVREANMICRTAWKQGRVVIAGIDGHDQQKAMKLQQLLRWVLFTNMRPQAEIARKLATTWRNSYGISGTLVEWVREERIELQEITLEGLAESFGLGAWVDMAKKAGISIGDLVDQVKQTLSRSGSNTMPTGGEPGQMGNGEGLPQAVRQQMAMLVDAWEMVTLESREDEFVKLLHGIYRESDESELRDVAMALREEGKAELPQPFVFADKPYWRALKVGEHLFLPTTTLVEGDPEWFVVRDFYSETELKAAIESDGFYEPAVDLLVSQGGGYNSTASFLDLRAKSRRWQAKGKGHEEAELDTGKLFEVLSFYYFASDPKSGRRGLFRTKMATACTRAWLTKHVKQKKDQPFDIEKWLNGGNLLYLKHEALPYRHGKTGLVKHTFALESDVWLENRGIPWYLYTYQNELKANRDGFIDNASMQVFPPARRALRDMDTPLDLSPGGTVFELVRGSTEFMTPPSGNMATVIQAAAMIQDDSNRLFGAFSETVPAPVVQLHTGDISDNYLDEMVEVITLTWQLCQQFMSQARVTRILGPGKMPLQINRDEIQGQYDFYIAFDARTLDGEFLQAKMAGLGEVKKLDTQNLINMSWTIRQMLAMVDPDWPEEAMEDPQQQAAAEERDERQAMAMILSGQESISPVAVPGMNHQARMALMQQEVQKNPVVQMALQSNEYIKMLWDRRLQWHQFQVQQFQTNAQTGRTGVKPIEEDMAKQQGVPVNQ